MIQSQVTVVEKETIAPAWQRLTLACPELAGRLLPGQFLLLRCADRFTCYLRRPVFPACLEEDRLSLLVRPRPDPGLAWLSARTAGDKLDVIGPLGRGFPPLDHARNLLLVSDDQAIAPLLGQMAAAVAAGVSVTLALGGIRSVSLYPAAALPPAVEFHAATLDGSAGHRGPITDLLPDLLQWADLVCVAGSPALYRRLKGQVETVRLGLETGFLYGLIAGMPLACGVGACFGCTIETETGLKTICQDGPVFDLATLSL